MNQTEYFPHLLKKQLELYALDWVKQYPDVPIKSIILYAYMARYEQYFKGSINIQYAVVFEIDETEEEEPVELNGNEYRHKKITGEIPAKPYEKLLADTRAFTRDDVAIIRPAAFKNVYRQPPPEHYKGEWTFILKFLKTELPETVRTSRPCWILFSSKQVKDKPKPRPNQQDKIACQNIAKKTWDKYPILDTAHMKNLPDIKQIVGRQYKDPKTVSNWFKEIAPDRAKQPGRRSRETRIKQKEICEKLGIKYDFKL